MSRSTLEKSARRRSEHLGIIVLGMHRSGTSLAARLLGELGCDFGGEVMPARADNPLGFWEHAEVVEIHDDFLAEIDRTWSDPRPLAREHFEGSAAERAKSRLEVVFRRDFAQRHQWLLKDPRICRLLPLWDEVLDASRHRLGFLHVVRHPVAIARSLARRDRFSESSSQLLWLRHVLESERWTRGRHRAWIAFEHMVQAPVAEIHRALIRLGIDGRFDLDQSRIPMESVVRPDHVHHESVAETSNWIWADQTRRALRQLLDSESREASKALDVVSTELAEAEKSLLFSGTLDLIGLRADSQSRLAEQRIQEIGQAKGHIEKLEREVASLTRYNDYLTQQLAEKLEHESKLEAYSRKLEALLAVSEAKGSCTDR